MKANHWREIILFALTIATVVFAAGRLQKTIEDNTSDIAKARQAQIVIFQRLQATETQLAVYKALLEQEHNVRFVERPEFKKAAEELVQ